MKEEIIKWLKSQQLNIEKVITDAAENFSNSRYVDRKGSNFLFDLKECERESLVLSRGGDLCYDRHTIGMSYALWYQGRRINTSLSFCIDFVIDAIEGRKPLEIFDLGAGTGAVQIAIGLCLQAASDLNLFIPKVHVVNVDISPFMLDFNRSFLWKAFKKQYPIFSEIQKEFSVNSWVNPDRIRLETPYIIASYLFDHKENHKAVASHFENMIKWYRPEKVVLLTSNQPNKVKLLNTVANHLESLSYNNEFILKENIFDGPMLTISKYRKVFNNAYGDILSKNRPKWDIRAFYARILNRKNARLSLEHGLFSNDITDLSHAKGFELIKK